jgi:AcrR family transcriptional regulator
MPQGDKPRRPYRAPARTAAAARTREAILASAQRAFESRGWAGTTIAAIATGADVSSKTVEAVFRTKASLLAATVDYAIRGDVEPVPVRERSSAAAVEAAPDAASMLDLHAAHLRAINDRSARLAFAVEHAATSDARVAALWAQMNDNRRAGVRWAADTLASKPGANERLTRSEVESFFWVALDWGTYRVLTAEAGLDADGYEAWLRRYYTVLRES